MKRLILFLLSVFLIINGNAQRIVFDAKTTSQVSANGATVAAEEGTIGNVTEQSKKSQEKAALAMGVIQGSVTLYQLSLENTKGFEADSKNLIEIARLAKLVGEELINVTKEIEKSPQGTISSYKFIQSISEESMQCIQYCYSLVTNAKIKIPGFSIGSSTDGANLIDPKDRLDICNRLIVSLKRLYNICIQIKWHIGYSNSWGRILQQTFPYDYFLVAHSHDMAVDIINSFK
ncbi:hypothetical protein FACS189451_03730 [Bacteroidia bacterium]|nr:hypothetical protein FACS189446_1530 [Bacteroidia bacterium]GHT61530.1 hypothetical protein FACS189451_03730 [Bacteroidia bacterium]